MVSETSTDRDHLMAMESPACDLANSAVVAEDFVGDLLFALKTAGTLPAREADAAAFMLNVLRKSAEDMRDTLYSNLEVTA